MDESLEAPDPDKVAPEARHFAARRLGPHSERVVSERSTQVRIAGRMAAGRDLEDAVLAEVHEVAGADRDVGNEFVAFFLTDLVKLSGASLSRGLHRHVDSGDLVQSVLRDVWPHLAKVRFETRGRFLAFLSQRLGWKASAKARKVDYERDAPELDESGEVRGATADRAPSPLSALASEEERELLILKMVRLPERDRSLLAAYLREEPIDSIAERFELSRAAAHKAVQRAIQRFRALR